MDRVANPAKQRAELFREAGSRRGAGSAVTEKDFWVCWVLRSRRSTGVSSTSNLPRSRA